MKSHSRPLIIAAAAAVVVLGLVLAFLLLGRGPGRAGPADPLERFPARCGQVVVVPDLGRLGERLAFLPQLKLAQLGATLAGYPDADAFIAELTRAAGVDLRSRESLLAAGIDPSRPLLVFVPDQGGGPVAAVPTADLARLEAFLARHAEARLAARERGSVKAGAHPVTTLSAKGAASPSLSHAFVDGFLFVAARADGLESLKSVLQQPAEGSLARDARFAGVRTRLESAEAFAFVCPGSRGSQMLDLPYGAGAALSLSPTEARLAVEVPLSDALAKRLESLGGAAGAPLLSRIDPEAFVVARLGLDPAVLAPLAKTLIPRVFQRALQQAQIAPADLLSSLEPGMVLSLSLASNANLGTAPVLDLSRTNPFNYLYLQALGRPRDPAGAQVLLEKALAVAPRFGATITEGEVAGVKSWTFNYHLGQGASIALADGHLAVSGGRGQLEKLLTGLAAPNPAPLALEAGAQEALEKQGFALHVDVSKLVASVRGLPDSAYGVGGFAIKAAIGRWLDAVEEIRALRVSGRVAEGTLKAELVLGLGLEPPAQSAKTEPSP